MKTHAQVVVIGGGVVGASVLYHLTKAGWKDVLLIERAELTSGSTWHAAGGMHTVNGDPNVAKLQQYTIELYKEIEQISGQSCGVHITGGIMLAGTRERLDWLKMAQSARPLSQDGARDHFRRRGGEALPADGQEAFRRARCTIPSRATSTRTASRTPMPNPRRSAARKSSAIRASRISRRRPTARGT